MRRYVRRGATGIAIIDNSGSRPFLRYVFDVADTGGGEETRPKLWKYREEYQDTVSAALGQRFDVSGSDLVEQFEKIAAQLAAEYWDDHQQDILRIVDGSFLEEYDEFNIGAQFRNAAAVSIAYTLMSRCGLEPENYFEHEDFLSFFDFNTQDTITELGTAVSLGTPVYKESFQYAYQHGEQEQYLASNRANIACKEAIEQAIASHYYDNRFHAEAAVRDVVKQFGFERMFYVLANTVQTQGGDGRISRANKDWAQTIPVAFENGRRDMSFLITRSHPGLLDMFVSKARHEHLLRQPLKAADIKAEAAYILERFQAAQEPNSPNGTHYMVQVSPDFLARAGTKDTDRLMAMLPFQTLSLSGLEGRKGTFALISKDEDRFQKLVLRRPSVRKKLQEQPAADAPKPPAKGRNKTQER